MYSGAAPRPAQLAAAAELYSGVETPGMAVFCPPGYHLFNDTPGECYFSVPGVSFFIRYPGDGNVVSPGSRFKNETPWSRLPLLEF